MRGLKNLLLTGAAVGVGAWLLRHGLRPTYDFQGKAILITGGSRGLGLVLAREFARRGAHVAICARDRDEVERAGQDLVGYGAAPLAVPCDITDPEQVRDLVQAVEAHFGRLDVLVNNAGIIGVGPLDTMTRGDFEEALAINFWGAYNTVEAALPGMRARGEGRIVNISSIGGKISVPHLLPYSVSKFALTGFSEGLRAELAGTGIVVTTVCPGLMRTGSPRHGEFKGQHRAEYAWFSISDSLPLLTTSAEQAARTIISACANGDAQVVLTYPAKFAVKFHELLPGLTSAMLALTARLLPSSGGAGTESYSGAESQSAVSPSVLTATTEEAARRNNEMVS